MLPRPKPIQLPLPLGVVCFAVAAMAQQPQQPYDWVNNPPPVKVFASALERVWAASQEKDPFRSIRGKFDPAHGDFLTHVVLPGGTEAQCRILRTTRTDPPWWYRCEIEKLSDEDGQRVWAHLAQLVQEGRETWDMEPYRGFTEGNLAAESLTLRPTPPSNNPLVKDARIEVGRIRISYPDNAGWKSYWDVDIRVCPSAKIVPKAPSAQLPSQVSPESAVGLTIEELIRSGRYYPLPTPQTSTSGTPGNATLVFSNDTQYHLGVLVSGATKREIQVTPGGTVEAVVEPGSYRIIGRISASRFVPFYGAGSYSSGLKYFYRFYVQ